MGKHEVINKERTYRPSLNEYFDPAAGVKMDDGTIYAGISPDTGEGLYALLQSGYCKFEEATKRAKEFVDTQGHSDYRLPTEKESIVIKANRHNGTLKGIFDRKDSYPTGYFWTSKENFHKDSAYVQKFNGYGSTYFSKEYSASMLAVRTGPRLP